MMKIQEIRELIKLVDQSSIDEIEIENDGSIIKMKKQSGVTLVETPLVTNVPTQQVVQAPVAQPVVAEVKQEAEQVQPQAIADENLHKIVSPMVGTFYQSPSPDSGAYVKVGSKVQPDSVVCIVEAMKLFNEIEAEVEGEIVEILVNDGQLVEYGQPLFLVKSK
ncbi:acetyl-CoA carboxylase biotin carboxyl carrier protein [Heyndrickxia vini]|uniref:Biotin carboxyl carrier protein of acetyl-CoA carboxylase n=1 Tax=Heyndrickxia vini TaxID=1476025 RepID=A0ABX7E6U9_9BACI|nr:acetyl-CoA carboxylase biotin carboxyl carrier protein [Heyndrickxia vini]QQZ11476.1 acetyl-CoA carboxylase biotin carboxyl carrier protein [Heyndrickxia vini]